MLEDFVSLKAGDVVVQNAANSMVGQSVIQLCKLKGVKTINLVRSRPDLGATVDYLKSIGGDVVVPEECVLSHCFAFLGIKHNALGSTTVLMPCTSSPPRRYVAEVGVSKAFGGLGDAKLGLNAVGGSSALSVTRALGANAKLVTYGSMCPPPSPPSKVLFKSCSCHMQVLLAACVPMLSGRSRKGSEVPAGALIFKNISSHGFWMTRWVEESSVADRVKMLTHLEGLVRDGKLKLLLERASFDDWNSALNKNWETYRDRKVVMLMK
jgi:trans-2-enoyl-CoA reductase